MYKLYKMTYKTSKQQILCVFSVYLFTVIQIHTGKT